MHRSRLVLAMTLLGAVALGAQNAGGKESTSATASLPAGSILDDDPAPLLGAKIAETLARFGPPGSVAAVRGTEAWQDDVAFAYPAGFTFFLYGDHVWQLRLSKPYAGSIYGLFLGDSLEKILSTLGQPYERAADSLVYRMPFRGYPVKLRLVIASDSLIDVYLYRSDF